jgi:hypothetical protein
VACDRLLSEFEATRKNALTMDYIDLCKVCFEDVKGLFPVIERKDLLTQSDLDISGSVDGDEDEVESEKLDTRGLEEYYKDTYIVSYEDYDVS